MGSALLAIGDLLRADSALADAEATAAAANTQGARWRAALERSEVSIFRGVGGSVEVARQTAEEAITGFDKMGDELGLARAWRTLAVVGLLRICAADTERAARQALKHAQAGGDEREEANARAWLWTALEEGSAPLSKVIAELEIHLEWANARGNRSLEGSILGGLAVAHARLGEFGTALSLSERQRQVATVLGFEGVGDADWDEALIQLLAGDLEKAEAHLRFAYKSLESADQRARLSNVAAELARVRYMRGSYDDAEELSALSKTMTAEDDLYSQIKWRGVRASAIARRGQLVEAERLAREGLSLSSQTDFLDLRAGVLLDFAEVMMLTKRGGNAACALTEAIALYEHKGDTVSANRSRAVLHELATS